jgi:hypothetical protein
MQHDKLYNDFKRSPYHREIYNITTKENKQYIFEIVFNVISRRYNEYAQEAYLMQRCTLTTLGNQRKPITTLNITSLPYINEYINDVIVDELLLGNTLSQRKKIIEKLFGKWLEINIFNPLKKAGNKLTKKYS